MEKIKKLQSIVPPLRNRVIPRNLLPKRNHTVSKSVPDSLSPCSYNIHFEDTKIPMLIRKKDKFKSNDWLATPELLTNTPKVGSYDLSSDDLSSCCFNGRAKGGVMSVASRRPYENRNTEDHPLQYSTPHSSLLKRSYNARLFQSQ